MTKLSTPPFLKFFKNLKKHITLLTYLLSCLAARVAVTSLRRWGTIGHAALRRHFSFRSTVIKIKHVLFFLARPDGHGFNRTSSRLLYGAHWVIPDGAGPAIRDHPALRPGMCERGLSVQRDDRGSGTITEWLTRGGEVKTDLKVKVHGRSNKRHSKVKWHLNLNSCKKLHWTYFAAT